MWGVLRVGIAARLVGHSSHVVTQHFKRHSCFLGLDEANQNREAPNRHPKPNYVYRKHRRVNMSTLGNPSCFPCLPSTYHARRNGQVKWDASRRPSVSIMTIGKAPGDVREFAKNGALKLLRDQPPVVKRQIG